MLSAHGTVTIRPREVIPIYREEWDAKVTDYKYNLVNRDFVSRGGNLYQVKVQKPDEFIPAGIDPDSEIGERYWEIFNKLSPSVTNFLVIVDEDGKPQTLLSGGRIQARFLNIGSLNMSETRLWGGAEPMTGKGLALINDPGDRKFAVYNDANNYVEMFMREKDIDTSLKAGWGFRGVVDGKEVFQLGYSDERGSFIGPFNFTKTQLVSSDDVIINNTTYKQGFTLENNKLSFNRAVSSIYQRRVEMGVANTAYGSDTLLAVEGGDIWHQGTVTTPSGSGYTSRSCRFYASDIMMRGSMMMYNGSNIVLESSNANAFVRVPCVSKYCKPATDIRLDLDQTVVSFTYTSKINVQLPKNPKFGHTVIFLAGRKADLGIIGGNISNEKILNPGNNTIYNWCNISNRNIVIRCVFMDPWWHLSYDDVVNSRFGN